MNANTSWNAAVVTFCVCLAVFLASVIATTAGWHPVTTGRVAGFSAIALVASGVWLHLAAGRLERELDEDEEAES